MTLLERYERLRDQVQFYWIHPLSIPWISRVLCKLGRHDYELHKVVCSHRVLFQCFYCNQIKGAGHKSLECFCLTKGIPDDELPPEPNL